MTCRRYILLGASNVAISFPRLVGGLCRGREDPVEIFGAFGHGRSYSTESRVLLRRLPGIRQCGLWQVLKERPPEPAEALVTDVGNDLLFGVSVATIVGWVEECVRRLQEAGAAVTLVLPPAASVAALPRWRYNLLRSLLFPGNRQGFEATLDGLRTLGGELRRLGEARGLCLVEPRGDWFGLDPIHIRPRAQRRAWEEILASWPGPPECTWPGAFRALRLWCLPSQDRRLWGPSRTHPQPHELEDGSRLYLY